jgi:hypothetical protein
MWRGWGIGAIMGLAACADADGDGFSGGRDCDDANPRVFVGAAETCDGRDNDCNGQIDEEVAFVAWQDRDADGFGDPARARRVCKLPEDGVTNSEDCDDLDATAAPGLAETCDGADNDCDGVVDEDVAVTYFLDADGDGFGLGGSTVGGCVVPAGYARVDGDCDDANPLAWGEAAEVCDGVDNDCDGGVDEGLEQRPWPIDADGDGHGDTERWGLACGPIDGFSADALDCDDSDAAHGPDTPEHDDNGQDDDCDGWTDELEVPTRYPTVAAALAVVGAGDVVQIASGVHEEDVELPARPAVTLAGEGCGRSVLVGSGAGAVVTARGGALDGLTLSGGSDGGLRVDGQVVARNLCVSGNFNLEFGGGVVVESGRLELLDSRITNNSAALDGGGLAVLLDAELVGRRVAVLHNTALAGGGLNVRSGTVHMTASVFAGNLTAGDGGAVAARRLVDVPTSPGSTLTFENCTFDGHGNLNDADGSQLAFGAAIYLRNSECPVGSETCFQSRLTVRNTLFSYQWAVDEPVVYTNATDRVLEHNGYHANLGRDDRYAWDMMGVRGEPDYVLRDEALPVEQWDLRLQPGSAYIDAGDPDLLDPDGSRSDIGAFGGPDAPAGFDAGYRLDVDGDGMLDLWEEVHGLQPWVDDAAQDADGDGLDNAAEQSWGTDPRVADHDADGVSDGDEVAQGSQPARAADHAAMPAIDVRRHWVVDEPLALDGGGSFDPDGDPLRFTWTALSPAGQPGGLLVGATAAQATLTPDAPGDWTVEFTVDDGQVSRTARAVVVVHRATIVPDDVADLQQAIDRGADAVAVRPGVWTGGVGITDRSLVILGLGRPEEVVIDGAGAPAMEIIDSSGPGADPDPHAVGLYQLTLQGGFARSGGGLSCVGTAVDVGELIVRDNEADCHGGGVMLDLCDLTGRDLWVRDNRVRGVGDAPTCDFQCQASFGQGDDEVGTGGGLAAACSTVDVDRAWFLHNVAATTGGGLRFGNHDNKHKLELSNAVFQGNDATGTGLAIWFRGTGITTWASTVEHVVIADHEGLGAAVYSGAGLLLLSTSLFAHNDVGYLVDNRSPNYDVLYMASWDNAGEVTVRAEDAPAVLLSADPRVLAWSDNGDPDDDVWTLRPGSPWLDAGFPDRQDPDDTPEAVGLGGRAAEPAWAQDAVDGDEDGMSDGWERRFGLDPSRDDGGADLDRDGVTNRAEYLAGTLPDR